MDANIESLWNLQNNLQNEGFDPAIFPFVMQFNKRDLKNILTIDELKQELLFKPMPYFETVAYQGIGVLDAFREIIRLIYQEIKKSSIHTLNSHCQQNHLSPVKNENNDNESLESILTRLQDSSPHARSQAIQSLVKLRGREATPTLLEMLSKESNAQVRDKIIEAFALLKDERATKVLLKILNDEHENSYLRMEAAEALKQLGYHHIF